MSRSKQQIIEAAYDHIGLGSFIVELSPEELASAVVSLNAFIASLASKNVIFSPAYPTTENLSDVTNIPAVDERAITMNFAIESASKYGKQVGPILLMQAADEKRNLYARYSKMQQVSLERAPLGGGYRPNDQGPDGPFVTAPMPVV